ncbi:hypothetical protein Tco_0423803, partial [Tanacetum coccineum]
MNDLESRFKEGKSNVEDGGGSMNRQLVDTSISWLSNLIWGSKDNDNGGPADVPKDFIRSTQKDLVLLFLIIHSNNSSTEGDLYEKWLKLDPRYGSKEKFDRKI